MADRPIIMADDAGAPLLAELRALRAVRDRVGAVLIESGGCSCERALQTVLRMLDGEETSP